MVCRISQEIELQTYLNSLMDQDLERRLSALREKWSEVRTEGSEDGQMKDGETLQNEEESVTAEIQTKKDMLGSLFAQVFFHYDWDSILMLLKLNRSCFRKFGEN